MPARRLLSTLCVVVLLAAGSPRVAGDDTSHFHAAPGVPEKFPEHPAVGETAPDFALKDTDGKPLALGEYLGRGYLVLAFGSASSANFRKSAPELDRLARDWERMEVKVLLIYTREAHPATLRETIYRALPKLVTIFAPVAARANTSLANETARRAFARVAPMDLSRRVLAAPSTPLAVLPVSTVRWDDLGQPARVYATRARLRARPMSA